MWQRGSFYSQFPIYSSGTLSALRPRSSRQNQLWVPALFSFLSCSGYGPLQFPLFFQMRKTRHPVFISAGLFYVCVGGYKRVAKRFVLPVGIFFLISKPNPSVVCVDQPRPFASTPSIKLVTFQSAHLQPHQAHPA